MKRYSGADSSGTYIEFRLDMREAKELAAQIKNAYPRWANTLLEQLRQGLEEATKEAPCPT